jgi:hypothetical protein
MTFSLPTKINHPLNHLASTKKYLCTGGIAVKLNIYKTGNGLLMRFLRLILINGKNGLKKYLKYFTSCRRLSNPKKRE